MQSVILPALVLVAGLCSSPAAQQLAGPSVNHSQQLGLQGTFVAAVNLPLAGGEGLLDGVLLLGTPRYLLRGELPSGPLFHNGGTGFISGPIGGTLEVATADPAIDPVADVTGQWTWNPATNKGYMTMQLSLPSVPGVPGFPLGVIRSRFDDAPPVSPGGPDSLGVGQGTWTFFLITSSAPTPDGDPYPGPVGGDA